MILIIIMWILTGIAGYLLVRTNYKRDFGTWSVGSRNNWIVLSILMAPIVFIAHSVIYIGEAGSDKPSSW